MRFLTDRHEIAAAINFDKYPVIKINRENRPFEGSAYSTGDNVRVAWDRADYPGLTTRGRIYYDPDDEKYHISGDCTCLHNDFGRSDVIEMYEWANSALVHKGQVVIVIADYPSRGACYVMPMRVSDHIDIHCSRVATLEPVENDYQIDGYAEIKRRLRK